jgi:hypothetical protein
MRTVCIGRTAVSRRSTQRRNDDDARTINPTLRDLHPQIGPSAGPGDLMHGVRHSSLLTGACASFNECFRRVHAMGDVHRRADFVGGRM